MNSQNAQNCPPADCGCPSPRPNESASEACGHTERSEMCGKQKLEPQNKKQLICSAKNCQIFGVHDTEPMPDYPCPATRIKAKDPNKNSLGSPVGMVASNVNFKTEGKPSDIAMARYATYLKAFARLHLNPETMWTPTLIDELMREGLALLSASDKEENKLDSPVDIYTANEKRILREFEMSGCQFQVELMKKFKLKTSASAEIGAKGDGNSDEVTLNNLKPALRAFFRQYKYCLVSMGTLYSMVWHSRGFYFVLDVCGRKLPNIYSDREKGVAMLICLKTLENVRHLLIGLTNIPKVDFCALREMKLVKVVTPTGGAVQRDYGTRYHQYEIINDDYAYLKASLHLTLNKADLLRNRSALPVGVAAIVASKIDHPATWNTKMLDKVICFGVNFCQACWAKCIANDPVDVEEFPSLFNMGQFRVNTELIPRKYEGIWHCVPGYKFSELARILGKAFEAGDNKLLLQINYQMYAIWKKQGFIYLLDPYRHRVLGKPGEPEVYEEMEKTASIRMFRSFEVFMNTLNHILLDSNRTSKFYVHTLKIKSIQFRDRDPLSPDEEAKLGVDGDVRSLNEHICFEESEELCQKALADISDYEDDDLRSDVDELELKTSSSEAEEGLEEEEGGAGGAEEELEGLESSSSGEDEGKKGKGGGKAGKGGKGGKSKKGGKGGKGDKGKPGKGGGRKGSETGDSIDVPDRKKAGAISNEDEAKKKGTGATDAKDKNKDINKGKGEDEIAKKKTEDDEARKKKQATEEDKAKSNKDSTTHGVDKSGKAGNNLKGNESDKEMEEAKQKTSLGLDKTGLAGDNKDKNKDTNQIRGNGKDTDQDNNKDKDKSKDNAKDFAKGQLDGKLQQSAENAKETEKITSIEKYIEGDRDKQKETDKSKDGKIPEKLKSPLSERDKNLNADSRQRQRRKLSHKDGAEADDENEDDFFKDVKRFCAGPNPNRYPGYFKCPLDMAVVGSESGSYGSLCKLLQAGFRRADRILTMTPWGNFVLFRCMGNNKQEAAAHYYLFDGCTCNVNRFRHLDLSIGTAGLLCFKHMHDTIEYMRRIRKIRSKENRRQKMTADEICWQYCG